MLKLRDLEISYPHQVFLAISDLKIKQAWSKAQSYSNSTARCQAHLNYLCWYTFIPWLATWLETENTQKNGFEKNPLSESSLLELWEFINGSIANYQGIKLALIPNDTTDMAEFDIPQEWVDIPQWQADYYIAIQINFDVSDQAWMRVLGSVSYQELTEKGDFAKSDRVYYINQKYLEEDISEILISPQLVEPKKPELVTPRELSPATANQLLNELGNPSVYYPRLAIPFEQWQRLITNAQWRQQLFAKRTQPTQVNIANSSTVQDIKPSINLKQWLHQTVVNKVEEGWQVLETLFTPFEPIPVRGYGITEESITKDAIKPLINLLQPSNPEKERTQAAGVLGKIGKGHPEVIEALIELLHTAKEEQTRWQAALSLGKIAPDNSYGGREKGKLIDLGLQLEAKQIALLVSIIPQTQDRIGVWIQLKSINELNTLPPHLELSIISETTTILTAVTRSNDQGEGKDRCLQLRFIPPSQTNFQVKITFNNTSFTEYFEV